MLKKNKLNSESKQEPTFIKLLWLFIKITIFSFGGGNALFPMIRNYCVEKNKWLKDEQIDNILIVVNSLPGPSAIEGIMYISLLLLESKWKATLVTFLSLIPHTLIFFLVFYIGITYIPMEYLKIIYVASIPVIIALLIQMSLRYFKSNVHQLPKTLFWIIFVITLSFCLFVPLPWSMPIVIILFFLFCLIIYSFIKKKKQNKKHEVNND